MNVPSCTVLTRRTAGLKVTVTDSVDNRDALLIDSGAMYGPPATLNSVPDGVMMICAGVGWPTPGAVGVAAGGAVGSRGGVTGSVGGVTGGTLSPAAE